jgi:glycosyltransferase involved in cell wall biosynthesis
MSSDDSITVVTPTRKRVKLLRRAIASVQQQDYHGEIHHSIIVDACPETASFLFLQSPNPAFASSIAWTVLERDAHEIDGSQRAALLRNHAVRNAQTRWIAFLDDDNEFKSNHLSSLVQCAQRKGYSAVHSQRELYFADGQPYTEARFPWDHDRTEGERLHQELCELGIFQAGSNVVRDRIQPDDGSPPLPISVDTGEWLIDRELFLRYPFSTTEYEENDWPGLQGRRQGEDDRFMWTLVKNHVPIACSELSTLKYYLGGYSNEPKQAD